jgi:hypothetical protein
VSVGERFLILFTDPVLAAAVVAGILAIILETIRRNRAPKKSAQDPGDVVIPQGQTPPVDHASGRVDDWKVLYATAVEQVNLWQGRYEAERERAGRLEDQRNALRDQVRALGHVPVDIPERSIPSVLPDEDSLAPG